MDHFYSACVLQCKDSCNMESDPIPMFDPLMALRRHHSPFPLPPPLLPHSHPTPWPADKEVQLLPSLTPAGSSNPTSSGTQGEILNSSYPLICKKLSWSLKPILDGFGSLLCNTHTHPRHSPTPPWSPRRKPHHVWWSVSNPFGVCVVSSALTSKQTRGGIPSCLHWMTTRGGDIFLFSWNKQEKLIF